MAARRAADQLIVVVGPTASGKSGLALRVARQFSGEIISADSRTIYKGLDIGTAKPSGADQMSVRHFGLDLVEPDEHFSAAQFQKKAKKWIFDIQNREKLPVMVGGTGLYIDSILFDYKFGPPIDPVIRANLEDLSLQQLWEYCRSNNIILPENYKNKRYVIRAIEQRGVSSRREPKLRNNTYVVGIAPNSDILRTRIRARANEIFKNGVVDEATKVAYRYGWEAAGLSGNIYPIVRKLTEGVVTKEEAIEQSIIADWHLAKRQLTWFKRNPYIHWSENSEDAFDLINQYLNKNI